MLINRYIIFISLAVGALLTTPCAAQITLDGTLGQSGSLAGPNYSITSDMGEQVGGNLFHSFGLFNVHTGESATFTGPDSVNNVIGRVTGGEASFIDGLIRNSIPEANLYLINPSGVMFGENARLDVGGSFAVNTADYLVLGDKGRFDTANPGASVLTSAPPSAFGFLDKIIGSISVIGSNLKVPEGENLSVAGGDITIENSTLFAPDGRIDIISVASAGEVVPEANGMDIGSFAIMGDIRIANPVDEIGFNTVSVSGDGGGSIFIRGGRLVMDRARITLDPHVTDGGDLDIFLTGGLEMINESSISTTTFGPGIGGDLKLIADSVLISSESNIFAQAFEDGAGGEVNITARHVEIIGKSGVSVLTSGSGKSGNVHLVADSIIISGSHAGFSTSTLGEGDSGNIVVEANTIDLSGSFAGFSADAFGSGDAGSVIIRSENLTMTEDAGISSGVGVGQSGNGGDIELNVKNLNISDSSIQVITSGVGDGGNMIINAENINISGFLAGLKAGTFDSGNAGNIIINGTNLIVKDDAEISSEANFGSTGDGGGIDLNVRNISLTGGGHVLAGAVSATAGNAGDVRITADSLRLTDGGEISVSTGGAGRGGNLEVTANEIVLSEDESGSFTSINARAMIESTGDAGNVRITTGNLEITNGAQISAATFGAGNGGNLVVTAESIVLDGKDVFGSDSSGIFATAEGGETNGNAGDLRITTGSLEITNGAQISAATFGDGDGGDINVTANSLYLSGGSEGLLTGIAASAERGSRGKAGDLRIATGSLEITDGAQISVSTFGDGDGGSLVVTTDDISMTYGGFISASTAGLGQGGSVSVSSTGSILISTSADDNAPGVYTVSAGSGNAGNIFISASKLTIKDSGVVSAEALEAGGGNINIDVKTVQLTEHGSITASVFGGAGGGGDININTGAIAAFDDSDITANAVFGAGGNINLVTEAYFHSDDSDITASSEFGLQGVVEVESPVLDLSGALAALSTQFVTVQALLTDVCATRELEDKSSFVIGGREGAPISPIKLYPFMLLQGSDCK